jgi:PKD repeat protein
MMMKRLARIALLALTLAAPAMAQPSSWNLGRREATSSMRTKGENRPQRGSLDGVPAQRTCTTMEVDSILRAQHPKLGTLDDFERSLRSAIEARRSSGLMSDAIYRIPIVVHVVHNGEAVGQGANISAAQVASQMAILNEDYRMIDGTPGHNNHPKGADVGIEFYLAQIGPDGHPLAEPGIDRVNGGQSFWTRDDIQEKLKPRTQWNPEKYLNIWVVKFDAQSGLLGYAQFPSLSGLDGMKPNEGSANTDGVVINYKAFGRTGAATAPFDGGRTATHEIGHWLGLRHIWGDGDCSVDDFCDDTPTAGKPNYSCDATLNSCPEGERDMIENYMDYTNDGCMNIFTSCQRERMRTVLERSPRRRELVKSEVGTPGTKPIAQFAASRQFACEGSSIVFNDQSTNSPTRWDWTFYIDGEAIAQFDTQNPSLTFTGSGVWDVQLVAANASGSDTMRIDNYVAIISSAPTALPFVEAMEDETALPGWTVLNPDDDRTWSLSNDASAGFGTTSAKMDNYSLDTDPSGTVDGLVSASIDLDASRYAELSFDIAYAEYEDATERLGDTLAIFFSTDCGESWVPFWYKGGHELATADPTEDAFVPADDEWRHERISLGFLNGRSDVHLALINLSSWGNNVYLDNIRIAADDDGAAPVADFYVASRTVCEQEIVALNDASEGSPREWHWTLPGATPSSSSEQHPRVIYEEPGTYPVTLEVTNANGSDTEVRNGYITIAPRPDVVALASTTRIRRGESATLSANGADVYFWSNGRDDEQVEGSVVTVSPQVTTTYTVIGFSDEECPGVASVTVEVLDGPSAVEMPAHVSVPMTVAPNPAIAEVVLEMNLARHSALTICVCDMSGRVVMTQEDEADAGRYARRLDVSHLPVGTYAVRVATAGSTAMQRFVKR